MLLLLERLSLFLTDLFTCGNLIDNYLSTTLASLSSSFFSIHLGLDSLETLNLHHHVKSLLLSQIVFFELFVLFQLYISDSEDFRGRDHLVSELNIVILLIKLDLGFR